MLGPFSRPRHGVLATYREHNHETHRTCDSGVLQVIAHPKQPAGCERLVSTTTPGRRSTTVDANEEQQ
jgi:hypothetical protein